MMSGEHSTSGPDVDESSVMENATTGVDVSEVPKAAESKVNSMAFSSSVGGQEAINAKDEVKSGQEPAEAGMESVRSVPALASEEHQQQQRVDNEQAFSGGDTEEDGKNIEASDSHVPGTDESTTSSSHDQAPKSSSAASHEGDVGGSASNGGSTQVYDESSDATSGIRPQNDDDEVKSGEKDSQTLDDDRAAAAPTTSTANADSMMKEEEKESPKLESILDRDLPAPPTPSKETQKLPQEGKRGVDDVVKAFGAKMRVAEEAGSESDRQSTAGGFAGTASSSLLKPSPDVPFSPKSDRDTASPMTPRTGIRIGKGPPPTTQASEEKPFDFNRFLEQMKHKSAGPVGEYVRSFIKGFTKKPYRVSDQTKLIFDFLDFIALRMRESEVWARLGSTEFENAIEAMEKLLMNRLYTYTFSPAVRKEGKWTVQTDDLERDRVLKQRVRLFGWITEEHLDVPVGSHSKGFIDFAIEELHKINHYKAPRDKVICILNCCKVIFGLIRHLSSEENADTFIPILIFVVLRANPDHLISNVEYISRFRNPERLSSESGYYLSSLMGAIAFIETMDYTSLSNITKEEFEAQVEEAVEKMSNQPESVESSPARMTDVHTPVSSEKGQSTRMTPQGSSSSGDYDAGGSTSSIRSNALPMSAGAAAAIAEDTKAFFQRTGEAARAGIGASLGKPMGALGRLFQEGLDGQRIPSGAASSTSAVSSGRATPDTPPGPATSSTVGGHPGGAETVSARSRMWGLFGVDDEELKRRQQQQQGQQEQLGRNERTPRTTSGTSLNFGSWSRSMNDEAEPQTPISEELVQGRFAPLVERGDGRGSLQQQQPSLQAQLAGAPSKPQRLQPLAPQRRKPQRLDSIDPYSIQDDGVMATGARTPPAEYDDDDDYGSDVDAASPSRGATTAGRPRVSNLNSFLPSFLSDPQIDGNNGDRRSTTARRVATAGDTSANDSFNDEEAAQAAAEIEEAHLDAGVETLKSIFPTMDTSVCRLVLEDCRGDVQASIDKLLEMQ